MPHTDEFESILNRTLDDGRLSRAERQALAAIRDDLGPDPELRARLRSRAFQIAADRTKDGAQRGLIEWLEDVIKVLSVQPAHVAPAEACFSPGEDCRDRILELLAASRKTLDVCVFTITDNAITDAILDAHRRHVKIRVLTDDDKSLDRGSDIDELVHAGIPVVTDRSDKHMHHKFAVFDGKIVLTGSYNWTRSAADQNEENIVVSYEPQLCAAFTQEFESLWAQYG